MKMTRSVTLFGIALASAFTASAAMVEQSERTSGAEVSAASALLAVDRHRATVIDRIVNDWGDQVAATGTGINRDQLREMLFAMRADQLLAASLAGSLNGLRDVVAQALVTPVEGKNLIHAKALGDPGIDVVYVPVTPCRLVDTRAPFAAVYQNAGPFAAGEVRNYTLQGGNSVCLSQLPSGLNPAAVQLQVFGIPTNGVSGDIEVLPQGSAFGSSATLVFLGNLPFTSASTTARINLATNQIGVQVRTGIANVAIDVVGYFRPPAGGFVASVTAGSGISVGGTATNPTVGVAAGGVTAAMMASNSCTSGQVLKWNGSAWACAADAGGGAGTVTSVGTGAGLSGGPITASGTVSLAATNLLPTVACATNQIPKWNGSAWACAADNGGSAVAFVQSGNAFAATAVLGTTDDNPLEFLVNNTRIMRYEPNAISPNVIGGHPLNNVSAGVRGATIAGGGVPPGGEPAYNFEGPNVVTDIYGTVGGGYGNRAGDTGDVISAAFATIAGGFANTASGFASAVAGGDISVASGSWSAIGGGINNFAIGQGSTISGGGRGYAIGDWSMVPGGNNNTAGGRFSLAAGYRAKTQTADPTPIVHDGAFVWADSNDFDFNSSATNQFAVRATGGARIVLGIDLAGAPTWTCSVVSGGSWGCSSDRNLKQNMRQLDGQAVLAQLATMPIYSWNPKGENAQHRHFGPTAQDFHAAFGLGDSELRIGQQDADGVALAAIQGLNAKLDDVIADRDARIAAQAREITELRRAIEVLMARTSPEGKVAQIR